MKHFLIVTRTDATKAGLRGTDFYSRSIMTHCRNLDYALIYSAQNSRDGVSVIAAYDVTDAYEANDHAGMFPATRDDLTSPSLVNLLPIVDLIKRDDYTRLIESLADLDPAAPARLPEVRLALAHDSGSTLGKFNARVELRGAYTRARGLTVMPARYAGSPLVAMW